MIYEPIVKLLNDLLTKTCDAEQGYQHSAGRCEHRSGISCFLAQQSELRLSFAKDISGMLSRLGAEPDRRACFTTQAHEAWNSLRSRVGDRLAILTECRRGEKAALEVYDRFLAVENLPSIVRALLVNQRAQIQRSLAEIETQLGCRA